MTNQTLSEKIWEDMYIGHPKDKAEVDKSGKLLCLSVNDVREKMRKLKSRLKDKIKNYRTATYNMKFLCEFDRFIDKAFQEEIGKELSQ